jgi:hypothetical protein
MVEVVESVLFVLEVLKGMWYMLLVKVPEVMRSTESISTGSCDLFYVLEGMRCMLLCVLEAMEAVLYFAGGVEVECRKMRLCEGRTVRLWPLLEQKNRQAKAGDTVRFASK